jgi:hypothetical protein
MRGGWRRMAAARGRLPLRLNRKLHERHATERRVDFQRSIGERARQTIQDLDGVFVMMVCRSALLPVGRFTLMFVALPAMIIVMIVIVVMTVVMIAVPIVIGPKHAEVEVLAMMSVPFVAVDVRQTHRLRQKPKRHEQQTDSPAKHPLAHSRNASKSILFSRLVQLSFENDATPRRWCDCRVTLPRSG